MEGIAFREAREADLPAIVALLADDGLGRGREDASLPLKPCYTEAFAALAADPNQVLLIADRGGAPVGVLQITYIPGLSRMGAWRAQIESVRVAATERGSGLGRALFDEAIRRARARGCALVQLTSDKTREGAHEFYARLGFTGSHVGYKLAL